MERVLRRVDTLEAVVIWPPLVGAWVRTTAATVRPGTVKARSRAGRSTPPLGRFGRKIGGSAPFAAECFIIATAFDEYSVELADIITDVGERGTECIP